eukprot:snap_masked-scaffold_9-processed-gene-13.67-mRNA-1 protein AED:1.00 eAED:1.00 QI:0/-1/0/0/-1/1/1/0/546
MSPVHHVSITTSPKYRKPPNYSKNHHLRRFRKHKTNFCPSFHFSILFLMCAWIFLVALVFNSGLIEPFISTNSENNRLLTRRELLEKENVKINVEKTEEKEEKVILEEEFQEVSLDTDDFEKSLEKLKKLSGNNINEKIEEIEENVLEEMPFDFDLKDVEGQEEAIPVKVVEEAIVPKVSKTKQTFVIKEELLAQKKYQAIAQVALPKLLPSGDYKRIIKDEFYRENFKFFYRFRQIKDFADFQTKLTRQYQNTSYFSIGKTYNKKNINTLEFGDPTRGKHIFIVSALKGCEWVSPQATLHTALTLLSRETTSDLLNLAQFHVITVANPDGFEYSRKTKPHWCKNRRLVAESKSHGVDLSKNFGTLSDPVPQKKKKKKRKVELHNFTEEETKSLKRYIEHYTTGKGRVAVLNIKCCSGEVIPPKAYKDRAEATTMSVESGSELISKATTVEAQSYAVINRKGDDAYGKENLGNMIDWVYSELDVDHVYEISLKASGLTTRTNHNLVSEEPFVLLCKQLERAVVLTTQLLLSQPVEGRGLESRFISE